MRKNNNVTAAASGGGKKGEDGGGGDSESAFLGRWQFSVESETDSNVFAAQSSEDREGWLEALLTASSYCHAISDARLQLAQTKHKQTIALLKDTPQVHLSLIYFEVSTLTLSVDSYIYVSLF
jgi:hypothetical protein